MYANLTITKSSGEQFAAWMVDVAPDGVAVAYHFYCPLFADEAED